MKKYTVILIILAFRASVLLAGMGQEGEFITAPISELVENSSDILKVKYIKQITVNVEEDNKLTQQNFLYYEVVGVIKSKEIIVGQKFWKAQGVYNSPIEGPDYSNIYKSNLPVDIDSPIQIVFLSGKKSFSKNSKIDQKAFSQIKTKENIYNSYKDAFESEKAEGEIIKYLKKCPEGQINLNGKCAIHGAPLEKEKVIIEKGKK